MGCLRTEERGVVPAAPREQESLTEHTKMGFWEGSEEARGGFRRHGILQSKEGNMLQEPVESVGIVEVRVGWSQATEGCE